MSLFYECENKEGRKETNNGEEWEQAKESKVK